ncbi:MAG: hypothetical protein V4489_05105 [Chlamydiota bacterium]
MDEIRNSTRVVLPLVSEQSNQKKRSLDVPFGFLVGEEGVSFRKRIRDEHSLALNLNNSNKKEEEISSIFSKKMQIK